MKAEGGLLLYFDLATVEGYSPIGLMNKGRKLMVKVGLCNSVFLGTCPFRIYVLVRFYFLLFCHH
jgi:hypothetical protein